MDTYIGTISFFAGNYVPVNWMACNGQVLPIMQHTALFSILGTQYGGDGKSTFALPNLGSYAGPNPQRHHVQAIICVLGVFPPHP
jgi:microcystin-dependent protein